jgi:hypothetical protein
MRTLLVLVFSAGTAIAAPLHLEPQNIVGDWISLQRCSDSLWKFSASGKYFGRCHDSIEGGRWTLQGGDKIIVTHYDDMLRETVSPKSPRETFTILGFETHSDRTFMWIPWHGGTRDKLMK